MSWIASRARTISRASSDYDLNWRDDARRFEQITLPFQDFAGMAASLELLHELGAGAVSAHIVQRTAELLDAAASAAYRS